MIDFFNRLFTAAAPLIIASTGALFTELAGALAIFTEGFMTAGAFFAWVIANKTGVPFLGIAFTVIGAGLCGWALARFVRKTGANPFIAGLVVNIAAGGITRALSTLWFGTKGVLRNSAFNTSGQAVMIYASWFVVIAATWFINRTTWGIHMRASGLSPQAARERGIRPGLYWEFAWTVSAMLAALAGAFLCYRVGAYTPGGIAGRGWICLAVVFLGFRKTYGVLCAALVFALADMAAQRLQVFAAIPATLLLGLPNALALALYVVVSRKRTNAHLSGFFYGKQAMNASLK